MYSVPSIIDSLQDITIQKIDFSWIQSCVKIPYIRRAIKVIQNDGDYYPDLKDACFKRLQELDPALKKQVFNNTITAVDRNLLVQQLLQWEQQMNKNPQNNKPPVQYADNINSEEYFNKQNIKITHEQRLRQAQSQKSKGNQAMKSKDFNQAIQYYNKSIELDSSQAATYCNRALAYLKKNEYDKVIKDCTDALTLNPKYAKAYHRRSKAYLGLKHKVKSYNDLKQALSLEPNNNELNGQLKQLRQQMTQDELVEVDSAESKQFKRITIEQDSQQQQQEPIKNEMQELS